MSSRKGARRIAEIEPEVLGRINRGEIEAITLVECLAVDQAQLLHHAFPDVGADRIATLRDAADEGYTRRMSLAGRLVLDAFGVEGIARAAAHRSDTVRGWAGYMIGHQARWGLKRRLAEIRHLADDPNSGVREWAWLGIRRHIVEHTEDAIALLEPWTTDASANIRRFATETTRPRGVWCVHIESLKVDPSPALPLLEPLRADPTKYVQDSVANWLNDASKTTPDWVRRLTSRWAKESDCRETERICRRALRTLGA